MGHPEYRFKLKYGPPAICDHTSQRHFRWKVSIPLTTYTADKGPLWEEIVRNDGLQPIAYEQLVSWSFGDFILNSGFDNISSTIKARRGSLRSVSIPKR